MKSRRYTKELELEMDKLKARRAEICRAIHLDDCEVEFLTFVRHVWPGFMYSHYHAKWSVELVRLEHGEIKRLIVNAPPKHLKTAFTSILLPAWYLGKHPEHKVLQCHPSIGFGNTIGQQVKTVMHSEAYREIFPGVSLRADSKAAGRWATNQGGGYAVVGFGGSNTGIGGDLIIIDDPQSMWDTNFSEMYEWYVNILRPRLQPGGKIVVTQSRLDRQDLTGQLLQAMALGGEKWEHLSFPAIALGGQPLWHERWTLKDIQAIREALRPAMWQALYQQELVDEESIPPKKSDWVRR